MLTMDTQDDIRKKFFSKGKNISEIARSMNLDRKTVRKYVYKSDFSEPLTGFRKGIGSSKLEDFKEIIDTWLAEDKKAKRKQRHTAKRVFDRLSNENEFKSTFNCSYRTVATYVKEKKKEIYGVNADAAIPLTHKAGEAQVDFGDAQFYEKGELKDGKFLNVVFPHSNQGYQQLFYGENAECLLEGLSAIFEHVGGVPQEAWFDNTKTIVTKILKGGGRDLTDKFLRFKNHYGFSAIFCNPNSGNEKGCVENKVGYHRRNMLVPIPRFESLDEFNKQLLIKCSADGKRAHYRKNEDIDKLFEQDKLALHPLPKIPLKLSEYKHLKTDKCGKIRLNNGKHEYSSSPRFASSYVIVELTSSRVIILDQAYREIISHKRLYGDSKQNSMDWEPYLSQLAIRPRALKYSGVYEMMPEVLREYLDKSESENVGKILKMIEKISESKGLEGALLSVSEALSLGAYDADSLLSLHRRQREEYPLLLTHQ